jgi:hypothetical protein
MVEARVEELGLLLGRTHGSSDFVLGEPVARAQIGHASRGDRADSVLRLPGVTHLADGECVERRAESGSDLRGDLDTSPRQADDDDLARRSAKGSAALELGREEVSCLVAVREPTDPEAFSHHDSIVPRPCRRRIR